jgi:hypothetical protein
MESLLLDEEEEKKVYELEQRMDFDNFITEILESGFNIESIICELEEYLAEMEIDWKEGDDEEDFDYEIDLEGFYKLK